MATATAIAEMTVYSGPARAFRVDPMIHDPLTRNDYGHVVVCKTTLGGPRVEMYGCDEHGIARRLVPLPGSFTMHHDVSLDDACAFALMLAGGYVITADDADEVPA